MKLQNYQKKSERIKAEFESLKKTHPERFRKRIRISWSNWGFGLEKLTDSTKRLADRDVVYIELHGNHYGADLGYRASDTMKILDDCNLQVSGVCGMFSAENDLSSNSGVCRQRAVDYLKRIIDFAAQVEAGYILVVPGAVGRSQPYDNSEFDRSVESLRIVAGLFEKNQIRAAVEPIRSAEVSFCHTFADAIAYIDSVDHPGIQHINGDVYHMLSEESHVGEALLSAGKKLTNLHIADSNRCALGEGSLDLDTVIRALYCIGYNTSGCYVTPEPLGPGGDPYPAIHGKSDPKVLDTLVSQTVSYFRERESFLLQE